MVELAWNDPNVDWLAFPKCFCQPCKLMCGKMVPKEDSNWPDIAPTVTAHLFRPCSGILTLVGECTCHSYSKLYYLCLFASLFKLLPQPTLPHTPPAHPLIYAGPILMNSMKKIMGKNQPSSTCQVNCTKANRYLSWIQYQGKVLNWIF